jgi:iron complex transport system substrate-binding protein
LFPYHSPLGIFGRDLLAIRRGTGGLALERELSRSESRKIRTVTSGWNVPGSGGKCVIDRLIIESMRICSLLPGATEIACALGLADEIVGVSHECDFPAAARSKPVLVRSRIDPTISGSGEIDRQVGDLLRSKQSLYALDEKLFKDSEPDIILTQGLCDVCALDYNDVVRAARSLPQEPTIVSLDPHCLADILNDVLRIGEATHRSRQAESLVQELKVRIQAVRDRTARSASRPRVVCLEWLDPLYIAGHWVPEMVQIAGGNDILGTAGEPSVKIEWEALITCQPEILILMPCGFDLDRAVRESSLLKNRPGWQSLPAVKDGRVFAVSGADYFSRPGPRLVNGLEILSQLFHPQLSPAPISSDLAKRVNL